MIDFLFQKAVTFICCFFLKFAIYTADRTLCFIGNLPLDVCTAMNIKSMFYFYKQNLWMIKMLNVDFFFYEIFLLKDFYEEYILC